MNEADMLKPLKAAQIELDDGTIKDEYGIMKKLKSEIEKKYEVISLIGKGSYGCVSKALCIETGRKVALKIMKNTTVTEYEIIKLLREI